jgi:RDD family protein
MFLDRRKKIMGILEINPISVKKRMTELLFDYLLIITYLGILFLCAITYYYIVFNGVPMQTEFQAQTLTFFISVLPIMLYFTFSDYAKNGSLGKSKAGLRLVYQKKTIQASLIRNFIKFLPWQLGHMGTIHGVYSDFDLISIILSSLATLLALLLLAMAIFRKDKRHLGDLLAHTQVQLEGANK